MGSCGQLVLSSVSVHYIFLMENLLMNILTSDKKCAFYTGIKSSDKKCAFYTMDVFDDLHQLIVPFIRRRWRGFKITSSNTTRKLKNEPKLFGPKRKLDSKDEFLIMLMKLRLGLLNEDLADKISLVYHPV